MVSWGVFRCYDLVFDSISEKYYSRYDSVLKTLDTIGNCQRPGSLLTWCISTYARSNKPV